MTRFVRAAAVVIAFGATAAAAPGQSSHERFTHKVLRVEMTNDTPGAAFNAERFRFLQKTETLVVGNEAFLGGTPVPTELSPGAAAPVRVWLPLKFVRVIEEYDSIEL